MPPTAVASPRGPADRAAGQFLEMIPQVMCQIKQQLVEAGSELSIAQFRCMMMVQRSPDLTLGDLAEANGVSAPAMSKLVDGLVEAGLLDRKADLVDRRKLRLATTPDGRRKLDAVGKQLQAHLAERLGTLSVPELNQLERLLSRVNDLLSIPLVNA